MKSLRWALMLLLVISCFFLVKNMVYSTPQDPDDMEDIALEGNPRNMVINPDQNQAIVSSIRPNELSVIDLETNQIVKTIHLKKQPYGLAVDRALNRALVGFKANHRLAVIDLTTAQTLAEIKVGKNPCNVAVYEPDNGPHLALTANYGADTLSIVDLQTYKVIKTVPVGNGPRDVAVDQGLQRAVVISEKDHQAWVVDLNTYQVIARVPVGRSPRAVSINSETHLAAVANRNDKSVTVINLEDWTTRQISVDKNPDDLVINPLDNRLLVVSNKSHSLQLIDPEQGTTIRRYTLNKQTRGVDVNYLTNKAGVIDDQTDSLTLIQLPNPQPEITSISPVQFPRGSLAAKLIIEGSGFIKSSMVNFQPSLSPALPVTLVNNHKLEITLPASFFTQAGIHQVSVTNPDPEGGPSATKTIYVQNPVPILTTLEPAVVNAGDPGSTLTIYGSGFFPETTIWVNSQSRAATYVGSTEMKINLSSVDVASGGSLGIAALNPSPGGGPSNVMNLTVLNPLPVLSSLSPNSVKAGSGGCILTLNGSGFLPGATVLINNSLTPSTWISTSRMETSVPANLLIQAGSLSVVVSNPQPGGGQSGALSLTVTSASNVQPLPQGSYGKTYEDLVPANATIPSYDPKRFSLITGLVKDKLGNPLAGVLVGIHSRSEYGTVLTDDFGRFSLPTDGGGTITLIYQKAGFITAHRQVDVGWNTIATAETLVLIPEDASATALTFDGNSQTILTHKGSTTTDSFGTRSLTMVFTGDNQATIKDAQGNDQILTNITVRATEYPTPASMPAKLPPTSAFTYCAELSVDGAQSVRFAKPVTVYVDNFLGFNVGEIVPVGYYDRDRALWVPSNNGVVVRLLDTNGDGIVDAYTDGVNQYSAPGLTDPNVYKPGATYWRVEHTHFTPWDFNMAFGLPFGATLPNPGGAPNVDKKCEKDDCKKTGPFVESRSRIFHEDIPIPGTDMTLHYISNRAKGFKSVITIPVSGQSVPASLKNIIVKLEVAGRQFENILPPQPNQTVEFIWDGLDYLNNPVWGSPVAVISIGFIYQGVYYYSSGGEVVIQSFGRAGDVASSIKTRQEVTLWAHEAISLLRGWNGDLAEGWTISNHHYLNSADPFTLFKGDGTILQKKVPIMTTFAGIGPGRLGDYNGDGIPATQATLGPASLAIDKDGSFYIADTYHSRIRKIDANGVITTVAGNGNWGSWGDGGMATQAALMDPNGVAVDRSGNIFILDTWAGRIKKVDPSGIISNFAGGGTGGDGGPATQASLNRPRGIAVDNAGNVYVVDANNLRVRKIDSNGIISTVAGNGQMGSSGDGGPAIVASLNPGGLAVDLVGNIYIIDGISRIRKVDPSGIITSIAGKDQTGFSGDGGPATEAQLNQPSSLAVDRVGNLYIGDYANYRIRKVDTSGIITTIAGNGVYDYQGDNGPAVLASFFTPSGLAVDETGKIYIADSWGGRIRKVAPTESINSPGVASDIVFAEENGQGYIMDLSGLHKSTIDLATGKTLLAFVYDSANKLISIIDRFGNQTSIQRDGSGAPISVTSPDGILTRLTVDGNNHLTAITYPDNSSYSFTYTTDGLLTDKTDPRGNRFSHQFDSNGRVVNVSDPEAAFWSYARSVDNSGTTTVTLQTAEGNTTTYQDRTDATGAYTTTTTDPSGSVSTFNRSSDELTETAQPSCGMNQTMKYDLDPVYKYKYLKEFTENSPAGVSQTITDSRTYQDTNGDGISDLISRTSTINGKNWVTINNTLTGTLTSTSPVGRIITTQYEPSNLLTSRRTIPGLYDTVFGYDNKGRLTSLTRNTRVSSFGYNPQGFLASITDPENNTTNYSYDTMGRVIHLDGPNSYSLNFTYGLNGNMTILTNPSLVNHSFGYNKVNLNNSYQTPISGGYGYLYDKERNLIRVTFPSGRMINNIYNNAQLMRTETPEGNIVFNYLCGSKIGNITKGTESIAHTYDGSLITSETLIGSLNQTMQYTYNNDFKPISFTYAGQTTSYTYDNDDLLTGVESFTIGRNASNGLPISVNDGILNLTRTFNGYGEEDGENYTLGGQTPLSWSLNRTNTGRISSRLETVGGISTNYTYTYDPIGRLLTASRDGSVVEQYQYNSNGTRTYEMNTLRGISGRTLTYSIEDHLLTAGNTSYQYNPDGFLTSKTQGTTTTNYTYSSRGELLSVSLPDGRTIEYLHDPLARRIAKKVDGLITEKYLWQGRTRLLAIYDGNDNLLMRFNYADGRMPNSVIKSGTTYYLAYDQIGSLKVVTDSSGNIVKKMDYDSFGNIITDTTPSFSIPFGFAGGFYDPDMGLVRFGFRDYNPEIGRWTAKDPILFLGGDINLYGYVQNDPMNFADPNGLAQAIFNGSTISLWTNSGTYLGTWNASSGRGGSIFEMGQGAIPPGMYAAEPGSTQTVSIFSPVWYLTQQSWGQQRLPLAPLPQTETYGRSGFFIHGGSGAATAGCIKIPNEQSFFDAWESTNEMLWLNVNYGNKKP